MPDDPVGEEDNAVEQLEDAEARRGGHVHEHLDNSWPP
jgi:hypothetical protein